MTEPCTKVYTSGCGVAPAPHIGANANPTALCPIHLPANVPFYYLMCTWYVLIVSLFSVTFLQRQFRSKNN